MKVTDSEIVRLTYNVLIIAWQLDDINDRKEQIETLKLQVKT